MVLLINPLVISAEGNRPDSVIPAKEKGAQDASGEFPLRTGLFDYSAQGYTVFIPSNAFSLSFAPVLVCFPGAGVKSKEDLEHWSSMAEAKGIVVLDLDVDYNRIVSFADIDRLSGKITAIVDELARQYPINREKILLAGTSIGGMLAVSLGLRNPGKFAGVGIVSGALLRFGSETQLRNARGRHFYIVHGAKDDMIPIEIVSQTKQILEKNGALINYRIFAEDKHPVSPAGYIQIIEWMFGDSS